MGTRVKNIVTVNITRSTTSVDRQSFNIPLFIGEHAYFAERSREYSTLDAVAADIPTSSKSYQAALQFFGQELKPTTIVLGRKATNGATLTVSTVTPNKVYSFVLNGVTISFTSSGSPTAINIAAGLKSAATTAAVAGVTVTDNLDGTLTIANTGTGWSLNTFSSGITHAWATSAESWADALVAVDNNDDSWFGLTAATHNKTDQQALAASIEAMDKLYFTSTQDVTAKATTTTDIGAILSGLSYVNTAVIYSANADVQYPECAEAALQLQFVPGSATAKFKTLVGVTPDILTDTEVTNLKAKGYNTYEPVGGVNIITEGTVIGQKEFIDTMQVVYWTKARMRERIYFRLVNMNKIPFDSTGAAIIEAEIRAVYLEGVANGAFTSDVPPIISVPDVRGIDPNLRAQRRLDGVKFEFTLAGAIHFVSIAGNLSI